MNAQTGATSDESVKPKAGAPMHAKMCAHIFAIYIYSSIRTVRHGPNECVDNVKRASGQCHREADAVPFHRLISPAAAPIRLRWCFQCLWLAVVFFYFKTLLVASHVGWMFSIKERKGRKEGRDQEKEER